MFNAKVYYDFEGEKLQLLLLGHILRVFLWGRAIN